MLEFTEVFPPGYLAAVAEMRGQAFRDETMRDYITRTDELIRGQLATLLEIGIEDGSLRKVDVEGTAGLLFVLLEAGLLTRISENDTTWMVSARQQIDTLLRGLETDA